MTRVLITGGSGLVASTMMEYLGRGWTAHLIYNSTPVAGTGAKSSRIDLLRSDALYDIIREEKPEAIIHAAAYSSVDVCEEKRADAQRLHVDVTEKICGAAAETGSKVVFISTDAVFDGRAARKYRETDAPSPLSTYGRTKLDAEAAVLKHPQNVVLRTTVVYGWHQRSRFTNWVLQSLRAGTVVTAYTDQNNTPTLADDLARAIMLILQNGASGLFHATGKTCISRFDFALLLARKFGLDEALVRRYTYESKPQAARRPENGCLDSSKLERELGFEFSGIRSGVDFIHKMSASGSV